MEKPKETAFTKVSEATSDVLFKSVSAVYGKSSMVLEGTYKLGENIRDVVEERLAIKLPSLWGMGGFTMTTSYKENLAFDIHNFDDPMKSATESLRPKVK
jgi:hypothetical protein